MNFFTDLDSTIIYSKYPEEVCIEHKDDKEITYITKKADKILNQLFTNENFCFIPCTLRSYEQTMRVDFIRNHKLKYIICDNGATIYINGKLDVAWDAYMRSQIDRRKIFSLFNTIRKYINENNIEISSLKTNKVFFISINFIDEKSLKKYSKGIENIVDKNIYNICKQGKKLYIIPKNLNKSNAVNYLKNRFRMKNIITSGDSIVDTDFVKLGDIQIVPKHAIFRTKQSYVTTKKGIQAGEEILEKVLLESKK